MATQPNSTPSKRVLKSTKRHESDENISQPPSNQSQDSLKIAVGNDLENHTWQLDAKTIAKILSPKIRKTPLQADHADTLEDYESFAIDMNIEALESIKLVSTVFSKSKSERDHYPPFCDFLNNCVAACHQSLGQRKGKYYDDLKFIVWDCEVKDGVARAAALKPDLVGGKGLQEKDRTKKTGLYWRPPNPNNFQLLIPAEVKGSWPELVRQAGTYARCLFSASPLRQYAMVLGYNHIESTFRFLFFHRGGLTSSCALDPSSQKDQHDILRIFLAILSWQTLAHAGLPMWCNDGEMILPGVTSNEGRVQVKKVLHDTLCLRGRAPRVVHVCQPDTSKDSNVPSAESTSFGGPRRSTRLQTKANPGSASQLPPTPEDVEVPRGATTRSRTLKANKANPGSASQSPPTAEGAEVPRDSSTRSMRLKAAVSGRSTGSKATASGRSGRSMILQQPASGPQSRGESDKAIPVSGSQIDPKDDDGKPADPEAHITIPHTNGYPIRGIDHCIVQPSSENGKDLALTSPGTVVKFSWVSTASRSIEPDLLKDCSGLFGTLKHYYSFLVCHGEESPATNHLFLPGDGDRESCHWPVFGIRSMSPSTADYRALWAYVSAYGGHSLVTASDPKSLILAVLHACLGWFNMMQKGYHHRDISIGNIVMVDEAVKTERFEIIKTTAKQDNDPTDIAKMFEALKIDPSPKWDVQLLVALKELDITDKCRGFLIDGDMAIKMAEYFDQPRNHSRSGTYEFMSDGLLQATERNRDYLQSPVDDLFSLYYTMQWAAVFHNGEFATGQDIPDLLCALREDIVGDQRARAYSTNSIVNSRVLRERDYGQFVVKCHPFLRDWYSSLCVLLSEWKQCQYGLETLEVKNTGSFYTSLFSTFAVQGVAQLAALVSKHIQSM